MTLDEIRGMDPRGVVANLGVPIGPARLKCALLGYKVLQGAIIGAAAQWPDEAEVLSDAGSGGAAP
jgi:nitrogen fixation NifU-like protein